MPRDYSALVDRNADNCECATTPRCRCGCKGALHGMKHSAQWRAQQVRQFERDAARERAEENPGQAALL
jgi:hypothetical protein